MSTTSVVTLGESLGLFYSTTPAPLSHADTLRLGVAGAESNVAIGLQRLGVSTSWIGKVGNDSLGTKVLRELRAEGIDVHAIVDDDARTGLMIKERRTSETAKVWYYREQSAGSRLRPEDVPLSVIASAKLLHLTGITAAISDSAHQSMLTATRAARAAGTLVSFDVNHRSSLWKDRNPTDTYKELAQHADILFAGEDEAEWLTGNKGDPMTLAHRICAMGPKQVIIKLGTAGCVAVIDGGEYHQPAVPIQVVDTVGAGDAFVAGYLAELMADETVQTRLVTATQTGAFACLSYGDWEGLPTRQELHLLHRTDPITR
jgi:2-dehydro-3-deoxygluconokinase